MAPPAGDKETNKRGRWDKEEGRRETGYFQTAAAAG
jgi:hypothetical protein